MAQFSIIPERALRDPGITGSRLFALCAIGRFTSRGGKGVWAKNSTIAKVAGLDDRHFRRAVRWLVEQGYVVKRSRKKADGSADTNWLEILYDDPPPMSIGAEDEAEILDEVGAESAPTPVRAESAPTLRAKPAPTVGAESAHQRASIKGSTASPPPAVEPYERLAASVAGVAYRSASRLDAEFVHDPHREAYAAIRATHRQPVTFDAVLRTVHAPPTGGRGFPWETIGAGLLEQLGNGETFNVARLRGYCRSHAAGPPPSGRREASPLRDVARVAVGEQELSAAEVWTLCVEGGLCGRGQSRAALEERIAGIAAGRGGRIADVGAFTALVLAIKPWELSEITFAKTREEQLLARLAEWQREHSGRAA